MEPNQGKIIADDGYVYNITNTGIGRSKFTADQFYATNPDYVQRFGEIPTYSKDDITSLWQNMLSAGSDRYTAFGNDYLGMTFSGNDVGSQIENYLGYAPSGSLPTRSAQLSGDTGMLNATIVPGSAVSGAPIMQTGGMATPTADQAPLQSYGGTSQYPKPGETIGDLFTNPHDGITYNWRTGALVNDPKNPTQPAPTSSGGQSPVDLTKAIQGTPVFTLASGTLLKQGVYNNDSVKQLQTLLGITADGDFGPQTKAAVIAFQQKYGLTPDGIVGPLTSAKINEVFGKSGGTSGVTGGAGGISSGGTSTGTGGVATSGSARTAATTRAAEIQRIKQELEQGAEQPELFSSVEEFDKLRKEQGIVKDEQELAAIQNEMRLIQQELRQFSSTAGQGVSEGGRIGAVTEASRNASFRMEGLAIREQAVLARVNSKNSYISTAMQLMGQDYDRAYSEYSNEFNKNLKAVEMYNSELDDQKKDALTAFETIANLVSASGKALTPQLSQQLDTLALQAGLPAGLFQEAVAGLQAKEKMDNVKIVGDNVYMWTTDASGTPHLKMIQSLPSNDKPTGTELNTTEAGRVQDMLLANRGDDGYVDPYYYADLRSSSRLSSTEFDRKFGYLVNPISKQKFGVGTGQTGVTNTVQDATLQGILDQYGFSSIEELLNSDDVPLDVLIKLKDLI